MKKEEHVQRLLADPVYAIMGNEELCLGRKNIDVAKGLIDAGVKIIQYREKHKTWREKYTEASAIAALCHEKNVTFIMNDSTDLAVACGADGIHVGQDDAPAQVVRRLAGPDVFIGVSVNTIEEMKQAVRDGADYVGLGPMFPTQSKKDADEVVTPQVVDFALHQYTLPVVTIGGISASNIRGLYDQGFRSFAMISAIVSQQDMTEAVASLRALLR
ncbi:MAG: thiamine phosphate synthase [Megasphaera sp.]|nr:thiamine phosphate synthase [Megasphaera sp.]MCH4187273.1 thiamine phosphate synthase [Megasphaera sp.]MCH4217239.1 thiamine phosphate synthase [Megasphaera sp.]